MDLKTLTMEDLIGRFKAYEARVKQRFGDPVEGQHLMLTRKQWEGYAGKKGWSGSGSGGGVKTSTDHGTAMEKVIVSHQARSLNRIQRKSSSATILVRKDIFQKNAKNPRRRDRRRLWLQRSKMKSLHCCCLKVAS